MQNAEKESSAGGFKDKLDADAHGPRWANEKDARSTRDGTYMEDRAGHSYSNVGETDKKEGKNGMVAVG